MWEEAREAILASSPESSVYIGCDSIRFKKNDKWYAKYASVVVLHRDSRHGCKIFYADETIPDYAGLENRILTEVDYARKTAEAIADVVGNRHVELHIDVNPDPRHKSNLVAKQALGWMMGMGYNVKIKPDGWAATHAADHCARNKTFAG